MGIPYGLGYVDCLSDFQKTFDLGQKCQLYDRYALQPICRVRSVREWWRAAEADKSVRDKVWIRAFRKIYLIHHFIRRLSTQPSPDVP